MKNRYLTSATYLYFQCPFAKWAVQPLCGSVEETNLHFYFSIFLFCKESRLLWYLRRGAPEQECPQKQVSVLYMTIYTGMCHVAELDIHVNDNGYSVHKRATWMLPLLWAHKCIFIVCILMLGWYCSSESLLTWTQKNCWRATFSASVEQSTLPLNSYFHSSFSPLHCPPQHLYYAACLFDFK